VSHIRLEPTLRKAPASPESDSLYAFAFDDAAHAMALLAEDESILHANRAFCNILGYSRRQLRDRKLSSLTHPDDCVAQAEQRLRLQSSEPSRYTVIQRCIGNDGGSVWVRLSVSTMRIGPGKPVNFVAQLEKLPPTALSDNGNAGDAEATRFRDATLSAMHEIGNSLTPLMMNTEMLVEQTESSESEISESARQIFKAARRIVFTLRRVCGIEDVHSAPRLAERNLDLRLLRPRPPANPEESPPAA
jgi:PAS domain S-box-containing protein